MQSQRSDIVCKFGGTSLADASQFRKVKAIVTADPERRYVVPSAPGKRHGSDEKITDLLYRCHARAAIGELFDDVFDHVADRFLQIAADLGLSIDLQPHLERVRQAIPNEGPDYAASRGEALNGLLLAEFLGYDYVDAADVIFFDARGRDDAKKTQQVLSAHLRERERAVIPGFYGIGEDGRVRTFSRGGSDITGSIVARAVGAAVYENWTDVSGFMMTDPRIVEHARTIERITYAEIRELSYMGATVLHTEAVFPVYDVGIPIHIRNVNDPEAPGTWIVREVTEESQYVITGVAGRRDFTVINIARSLINEEIGYGRRLLGVVADNGISFDHLVSGIDSMSIIIANQQLTGKLPKLLEDIRIACEPDTIDVISDTALIATVGRRMLHRPGIAGRLFGALAAEQINVRLIAQGSSELNIIVGVAESDFENAVRTIYRAFTNEKG